MATKEQIAEALRDAEWVKAHYPSSDRQVTSVTLAEAYREAIELLSWAWSAIDNVRRGESCWCERGIGNPMLRDHTVACKLMQDCRSAIADVLAKAPK